MIAAPEGGRAVTRYPVMGAPPVSVGAVHERLALFCEARTEKPVGAPANPSGVIAEEGEDGVLRMPASFIATTMKL